MNKKIIVILIVCLWVVVAAAFIFSKQIILKTGKTVLLETLPVDPRDLLRGDYVVLSYKIGSPEPDKIKKDKSFYRYDETVYVTLEQRGKYWESVSVSSEKPATGKDIFIKGRTRNSHRDRIEIIYGIESYFVPEGQGKEIELATRMGSKQKPAVEAVIDKDGNAIIRRIILEK